MSQKIWGLFVCLLLLSVMSCSERTPQATDTSQATQGTEAKTTSGSAVPEAGWKAIAGEGIVLSLPGNYEGGNPSTDIEKIGEQLKAIAPDYNEKIQALKRNPEAIALIAFDPQSPSVGTLTNVSITKQKATDGTTVEQYLKSAKEQLTPQYNVVEQKLVSLDQYQAGRMVAEATAGETPIKQLFYVVQDGNIVWLVTYSTTAAEFDQRLPNFEKSIRTLKFPT
jgi:serine/threonine-protein kinase